MQFYKIISINLIVQVQFIFCNSKLHIVTGCFRYFIPGDPCKPLILIVPFYFYISNPVRRLSISFTKDTEAADGKGPVGSVPIGYFKISGFNFLFQLGIIVRIIIGVI